MQIGKGKEGKAKGNILRISVRSHAAATADSKLVKKPVDEQMHFKSDGSQLVESMVLAKTLI